MALMKCPECFGNCSDKAMACPHCGFPIQSNKTNEKETLIESMMEFCDTLVAGRDTGQSKVLYMAVVIDSEMDQTAKELAMQLVNFIFDPPHFGKETSRTIVREQIQKLLE